MAEKGFGVKEINLIGPSGTPTITSPNNLNLNAVNVAISTNVSIGGTLTVSGNISIGGTLTYEDVTNIDSVGIITAREGIRIGAGKSIGSDGAAAVYYGDGSQLTGIVGGAMTAYNNSNHNNVTTFIAGYEAGEDIQKQNSDGNSSIGNILIGDRAGYKAQNAYDYNIAIGPYAHDNSDGGSTNISIGRNANSNNNQNTSNVISIGYQTLNSFSNNGQNCVIGHRAARFLQSGTNNLVLGQNAEPSATAMSNEITLGDTNISHFRIPGIGVSFSNNGAVIAGVVTATSFSGSGASLTNLPAANITGTLPAISGANLTGIAVTEAPVVDYTITANGSSAYRFHGGGVDETADDPDLYLVRGQKYRFNNTTGSSHPFAIREASGGSAYSNGVTGSNQGVQFFTVPYDAPAKIFYQCTIHSGMVGNIYIRGAGGQNDNVGITTFTGLIDVNQLKKTSGTLDYLAATHTFNNAAGSSEYLRITSGGFLKVNSPDGGSYHTIRLNTTTNNAIKDVLHVHSSVDGATAAAGYGVRLNFSGEQSNGNEYTFGGIAGLFSSTGATYGDLAFYTNNNGTNTERLRIGSDGKITSSYQIVNATAPDFSFEITQVDTSNTVNQLGGSGVGLVFKPATNSTAAVGAGIAAIKPGGSDGDTTSDLAFYVSQNDETLDEALRITSVGQVSIGDAISGMNMGFGNQLLSARSDTYSAGIFGSNGSALTALIVYADHASYAANMQDWRSVRSNNSAFNFLRCSSNSATDNEFFIGGDGVVYSDGGTTMQSPADYAEMFEWSDGNSSDEDRRGYTVVLDGNKVRIATSSDSTDNIIGVVSGNPAVLADNAWDRWAEKYQKDDYNCYIRNSDGDRILNSSYDDTQTYVPREDRKEWDAIGMVGKLRVRKGQQTGTRWLKMRDVSDSIEEWLVR